jgi:ribosome recycling factor
MAVEPLEQAEKKMKKSVEAMRREFASVRTGKATPQVLDSVRVEAYESRLPLNQVANVSAPEPQLLVIQPYDQNLADDIAHAVRAADLGLNPSVDGSVVRVPVPPLSEERRKEMVKRLHTMAEDGRIAVRQVRQDAKNRLQEMEREGEISEDAYHRFLDDLQEMTDGHIERIDGALEKKEAEVMEV